MEMGMAMARQERVLTDVQGVSIDSANDKYPQPHMLRSALAVLKHGGVHMLGASEYDCMPHVVYGEMRLFCAVWFLQTERTRELLALHHALRPGDRLASSMNVNARFPLGDLGNRSCLHWLCSGKMPSGFSYSLSKQHAALFDELVGIVASVPGADLVSPDPVTGLCPIVLAAENGMEGSFAVLVHAGAADSMIERLARFVQQSLGAQVSDTSRGLMLRSLAIRYRKLSSDNPSDGSPYAPCKKRIRVMPASGVEHQYRQELEVLSKQDFF
ncbi:hypothetical protein FVE85_0919 [Porphyridium purpureum]|uniref:Uncharacterized protein n=1 Tax=Porphyridium purpureum TaxID=35688 RepID=A0A5J4Z1N8_PORPP|nr:hypothetical protein FVE85_0919 [Porphyridium purpureum]|eukprot:POR5484..scf208_2